MFGVEMFTLTPHTGVYVFNIDFPDFSVNEP